MYSIVIPIYNEHETIPELHRRLAGVMNSLGESSEVIFVDDGSADESFRLLTDLHAKDSRFKVLRFSRNFGHQMAISAGIDHASGDAVILMDGDLQDPPEIVPRFLSKWREGFEVVYAIRKKRKENIFKRAAYASFYRILRFLSYLDIPLDSGDFCLMDKKVVTVIRDLRERSRFVRGLRTWAGFKQVGLEYERDARYAGDPKYTFTKLMKLAYDGLLSFSVVPLRMAVYTGFGFATIAFLGGLFIIYRKLVNEIDVVGWASTIVILTFLGGLILMTLGVIGEYVGRIYDEVKQRPLYVVRD
ncbi:MAG TPA: glycosyltransferase family 2 protein, partial [Bacteroidota bacterium]|nr:glycosyltransferase family 2 protein [Bacteroidota bacterium]